jgi:hypothetical protein
LIFQALEEAFRRLVLGESDLDQAIVGRSVDLSVRPVGECSVSRILSHACG